MHWETSLKIQKKAIAKNTPRDCIDHFKVKTPMK